MSEKKHYQPLDAMVYPRFSGIRTFMRLPHITDLSGVDFAIVGVPFDTGGTFRVGARFGPEGIRSESVLLRPYNPALDINIFDVCSGVDYGDLSVIPGYLPESHKLIEQGIRCKLFPAIALVQQLQQAKRDLDLMSVMTKLDKYKVIISDDIGYVKKTEAETHVLFEFIAHRYESGSLIITANQPFSSWDQIFPDSMMTVAAIDRLIHHASIIELEGESYRRQQQLKKSKTSKKKETA